MPAALREKLDPGKREAGEPDGAAPAVPDSAPVAPAAPPLGSFAGFLQQAARTRSEVRRQRVMQVLSLAAHAAVLVGAVALARRPQPSAAVVLPVVPVTMLRYAPGPPPKATAPAAAEPAPAPKPRPKPVVTPRPSLPAPVPTVVPPPESASGTDDVAEAPSSAAPEENGEAGGVAGGVAGTTASPGVVAAPGPSPAELRALLDRYLQQVLRPRILSRLVFPPEAERLGVEGKVLLRLRIGGGGQLLAANVAGACPHEILCEDALRTLRAASPLPPLPPALGPQVDCTFPVTYQLE